MKFADRRKTCRWFSLVVRRDAESAVSQRPLQYCFHHRHCSCCSCCCCCCYCYYTTHHHYLPLVLISVTVVTVVITVIRVIIAIIAITGNTTANTCVWLETISHDRDARLELSEIEDGFPGASPKAQSTLDIANPV